MQHSLLIVEYGYCCKIEIEFYAGLIENIINNAKFPNFLSASFKEARMNTLLIQGRSL